MKYWFWKNLIMKVIQITKIFVFLDQKNNLCLSFFRVKLLGRIVTSVLFSYLFSSLMIIKQLIIIIIILDQ